MPALFGARTKRVPININLVPKDPFFATPVGKILKWALSVGRYIVIFTELIVILSFITRFNLDRQVTDLNESINQKRVIIESFGELEDNVLITQKKTESFQQVAQRENLADIFPTLNENIPESVTLTQLQIQPNKITMEGVATSQSGFNTLITNLELSPQFPEVTVGKVGSGDTNQPGITFSISAVTLTNPQPAIPTPPGAIDATN